MQLIDEAFGINEGVLTLISLLLGTSILVQKLVMHSVKILIKMEQMKITPTRTTTKQQLPHAYLPTDWQKSAHPSEPLVQ